MNNRMLLIAAIAGGLSVSSGTALAQDSAAGSPEMIEGQVTQVDVGQGKLTIRAADGSIHEFEASRETLEGYKVGDPIKAKLRTPAAGN